VNFYAFFLQSAQSEIQGFHDSEVQVKVFWVVMPYSVAVKYHCFGGLCCLHL